MTPGERPASSTPYIKAIDDLRFSEDQLNDIIDSTEAQWKSQARGRSSDKASSQNHQLRSTRRQRGQRTPLRLSRRATIGLAAIGIASIGSAGLAIGSNVSGVSFPELLGKWLEAGSAENDNKDRVSSSADGAETTELIDTLGTTSE